MPSASVSGSPTWSGPTSRPLLMRWDREAPAGPVAASTRGFPFRSLGSPQRFGQRGGDGRRRREGGGPQRQGGGPARGRASQRGRRRPGPISVGPRAELGRGEGGG